jgi:para-aminobenzoate synthetase/4-amino-4-deoxychorismate lyase
VDPRDVFPAAERGVALHGVVVAGGLGAHKWADRRLLERAIAGLPPGGLPLLVEDDGTALEVSRGSVFVARRNEIVTPPLDGRILPGIARRQVLEAARAEGIEAREGPLRLADLSGGEEVFIAGSVRGIEPVRSIDGVEPASGGELSGRIAAGLRRRWFGAPPAEPVAVGAGGRRAGRLAR